MCVHGSRIGVRLVKGESFIKLLGALVKSVLLYGAEVWGCCRQMGPLEQVQMHTARYFWGLCSTPKSGSAT